VLQAVGQPLWVGLQGLLGHQIGIACALGFHGTGYAEAEVAVGRCVTHKKMGFPLAFFA
jgi:hypothetical protein